MNPNSIVAKLPKLLTVLAAVGASVSCMTTYDANGRPVQSVDPAVAVAGAAAAGLAGYAIANSNDHHHHGYYRGGYYAPRPYYPRTYGGFQGRSYRR